MQYFRVLALPLCALAFVLAVSAPMSARALSLSDKAGLQAAMQQYIDRQSVDGVYLYLDTQAGEVHGLHAVTTHPMILHMGGHFVLCYDFRDEAGESVNIDFYVARKNNSFLVFEAIVNDRQLLKGMMEAGKVKRAE